MPNDIVSRTDAGSVFALDHRVYRDEDIYRLEQERIFGRLWNIVGLEVEIPHAGDFKTTWVGEVPVVVLRDEAGAIRVFENVCIHRGTKLVRKPCGNAQKLTCIYHQWTYGLDGRLEGVAMPRGFPESFRMEDYRLFELPRVASIGGIVFAAYDADIEPLEDYLGGIAPFIRELTRDGRIELLGYQRYSVNANWKLFVENTVDGYHPGLLHSPIRNDRMRSTYRSGVGGRSHKFANGMGMVRYPSTIVAAEDWDPSQDLPTSLCKSRDGGFDYAINMFPNALILQLGDILTVRQLIPRRPDAVDVITYNLAYDDDTEELKNHRAMVVSAHLGPAGVVSLDDKVSMEAVQNTAAARHSKTILLRGAPEAAEGDSTDEIALRGFYEMWARSLGLADAR